MKMICPKRDNPAMCCSGCHHGIPHEHEKNCDYQCYFSEETTCKEIKEEKENKK